MHFRGDFLFIYFFFCVCLYLLVLVPLNWLFMFSTLTFRLIYLVYLLSGCTFCQVDTSATLATCAGKDEESHLQMTNSLVLSVANCKL